MSNTLKLRGKLTDVIAEIKRLYGEVARLEATAQRESYAINFVAWRKSLPAAIKIGELLVRVKESPGWHGKWLNWLKANVPFDVRTAQRYMKCYKRRDELLDLLKAEAEPLMALEGKTTLSFLADAHLRLTKPKTSAEPAALPDTPETDPSDSATEPEQARQRRRKSGKQIMKELERMNETEQKVEKDANGQLAGIIDKLSRKVKAAWPEFPDRLTEHGRALSELGERLRLNTSTISDR
jgi:Protein of unknown function (DUF3102)